MLRENGIGYLKIDYNASFLYADCENGSPAEGAREVLEAVRDYYKHIRAELPELTIEVCASGGYRLTPEWMRLGDMASFSDAHECECIPIVAANVQTLIPLRRSQVGQPCALATRSAGSATPSPPPSSDVSASPAKSRSSPPPSARPCGRPSSSTKRSRR
jgi:hypothetical protein